MRPGLLMVSPRYPWPTSDGFSVRVADLCHALAEKIDVHLLVTAALPPVDELPRSDRFASVCAAPGGEGEAPGIVSRLRRRVVPLHFDDPRRTPAATLEAARDIVARWEIDAALVHTPALAGVLAAVPRDVPRIIDAHDIWHQKYLEYRSAGAGRLLAHFRDPRRELALYRAADLTLAISRSDHEYLARAGVESLLYVPVSFRPCRLAGGAGGPSILYAASAGLGNIDAVDLLVTEILPRVRKQVPGTKLLIMGGGDGVAAHGSREGVEVLPFMENVDDAYRRAAVVVVPLRFATGLKIKVLESFARGCPTIISPAAAAGIPIEGYAQREITIDPDGFAAEVVRALQDAAYREELIDSGLALIRRHYSPDVVYGPLLDWICRRAAERHAVSAKMA